MLKWGYDVATLTEVGVVTMIIPWISVESLVLIVNSMLCKAAVALGHTAVFSLLIAVLGYRRVVSVCCVAS